MYPEHEKLALVERERVGLYLNFSNGWKGRALCCANLTRAVVLGASQRCCLSLRHLTDC